MHDAGWCIYLGMAEDSRLENDLSVRKKMFLFILGGILFHELFQVVM